MSCDSKTILHVDDDADDRELLRDMMKKVAPELKMTYAENGLAALEVLSENKEENTLPCLIVLDINMPYLNGKQIFESIKADPELKFIPVVVFSSSANPSDKSLFSTAGVTYFTKPAELSAMRDIATSMAGLC